VGITPITATAPGATGAYRLTPEGVTFAQPVTLSFSYSAAEAGASAASRWRIATRDARGHWAVPNGVTHDAAQRKLSVGTTHFSDWSYVPWEQLTPASAVVRVRGGVGLALKVCGDADDPANAQRLLLECRPPSIDPELAWSVNGIAGGNAAVGTITEGGLPGVQAVLVDYAAPDQVPAQNPVAVAATLETTEGRMILVSNIKVVDEIEAYEGTFFGRFEAPASATFHNVSADLRFTFDGVRPPSQRVYKGTGRAHLLARPVGCDAKGQSLDVTGAELVFHDEGALAGTYEVSVTVMESAPSSYSCGPQGNPGLHQYAAAVLAGGGAERCGNPRVDGRPSLLSGAWDCTVEGAGGNLHWRSNWTLRAAE
jgi:hypothetical protein